METTKKGNRLGIMSSTQSLKAKRHCSITCAEHSMSAPMAKSDAKTEILAFISLPPCPSGNMTDPDFIVSNYAAAHRFIQTGGVNAEKTH